VASVDDLANVPLFRELDPDDLAKIADWFHVQHAGGGVRLVGEGAPGYTFFVLVDGTAEVSVEGKPVAGLAQGDFFGEMAILGDGRRTATVTSTSPARLLVMFGTEFRRLKAEYPAVASRLTEGMQVRARELAALA
jgi:CRP-like cAMP-binding protein